MTNVAMITVGCGVFNWLVPPYARNEVGISARLIELLLFANGGTVVVAQMPIAKLAEGRRRAVMMAVAAVLFVVACLLVVAAGITTDMAYTSLVAAAITVGVGECFHTTVLMPLVAELAPAGLRGRWNGLMISSAVPMLCWAVPKLCPKHPKLGAVERRNVKTRSHRKRLLIKACIVRQP